MLWGPMVGVPVVLLPAVGGALVFRVEVGIAAGGAATLLAVALAVSGYLDARMFGWAVREHDQVTRQGVVWRKTVVVPLVRIQHVGPTVAPWSGRSARFGCRRIRRVAARTW